MKLPFKTLHDLNTYFKEELDCYRFLENQWWEGGAPVCPYCDCTRFYSVKSRSKIMKDAPTYRCANRSCLLHYTVKTGTIFEGSKIELRKWFQAIYELTTSKKGISSVELGTRLGISQKSAWLINHKLRDMIAKELNSDTEFMGGGGQIVEVDESYVGGKLKNMKKSKRRRLIRDKVPKSHNKSTVMGYLERGGNLKLRVLSGYETAKEDLCKTVLPDSVIMTDTSQVYQIVGRNFMAHEKVNHGIEEYVRDKVIHTNGIEGVFSLLDRAISGVFHYVSQKHIQRYCSEMEARFNRRHTSNIDIFMAMVKNTKTRRITYAQLTK